jgi:hypothetical protein
MTLARRSILKLSLLSLAGLAFRRARRLSPGESPGEAGMLGRVTRRKTPIYTTPDPGSPSVGSLERDAILSLLEQVQSPAGPQANPRWYRLKPTPDEETRYIHSAYIQRVDGAQPNLPLRAVPPGGQLGEITLPYIETLYKNRDGAWMGLYRLYYGSVHWITGVERSLPGETFYRLTDERLRVDYWTRAAAVRPLPPEEYTPLSPEMPLVEKRIEVSLERQVLTAWEGREIVLETAISAGTRYTPTHPGEFRVDRKYPSRHMGNGALTADLRAYELVGVPWVCFFQTNGIAFHGAYWHDNFGIPMSNGCVNLRIPDALWLFRWTAPVYTHEAADRPTWKVTGVDGTQVAVY